MGCDKGKGLPPPPPVVPSNLVPELEPIKKNTLLPMARRGSGTKGVKTHLLTNHFRVNFNNSNGHFFHYSVCTCFLILCPICILRFLYYIIFKYLFGVNVFFLSLWLLDAGCDYIWRWSSSGGQRNWQEDSWKGSGDVSNWSRIQILCLWWREDFVHRWCSSQQQTGFLCRSWRHIF